MRKFKGYQPVERNLGVSNPPKSGSGVSSDKVVVVIKLENEFTTRQKRKLVGMKGWNDKDKELTRKMY